MFRQVVLQYHPALVRTARSFVRSTSIAEEVAQDTWLAAIRGLPLFEGRSSFKTWLFRILINQARTCGARETRSAAAGSFLEEDDASVLASRFNDMGARWPRHWCAHLTDWGTLPETTVVSAETESVVRGAIERLPARQRQVITLRDIEGFDAREVSLALDLSEGNQRVLLHRARSRVRAALELHLEGVATA